MKKHEWIFIEAEEGRLNEMEEVLKVNNMNYVYINNNVVKVSTSYSYCQMMDVIYSNCVDGFWYE